MVRLEKEEAQLPGLNSFRIQVHLHCFCDWQGRISVAHAADSAGRAGLLRVGRLGFGLFNFRWSRRNWRRSRYWSLFVLSGDLVTRLALDAFTLRLNTQRRAALQTIDATHVRNFVAVDWLDEVCGHKEHQLRLFLFE